MIPRPEQLLLYRKLEGEVNLQTHAQPVTALHACLPCLRSSPESGQIVEVSLYLYVYSHVYVDPHLSDW